MGALIGLFGIIPGWVYAIAVAALMVTNCASLTRMQAAKLGEAQTRQEHAELIAEAEKERSKLSEANRKTEGELHDAIAETSTAAAAALRAGLAAGQRDRAESDRLRAAAQATAAEARARCAAPTTAAGSPPGGDPIGVLADVLGRADQRAGALAAIADDARTRGAACEMIYDKARALVNSAVE